MLRPFGTPTATRGAAALAVAALLATACGAPDLDDYAQDMAAEALDGGLGLTEEEADCYGRRAADELGLDRLRELDGEDAGALTADDADRMAGALVDCVDGVVDRLFGNVGREISAEGRACLAEELTEDDVAGAAAATLQGTSLPEPLRERFDAAFTTCAGVEVVALGAPGLAAALSADGFDVGRDEAACALERLVDELGIEAMVDARGASFDPEETRLLVAALADCSPDFVDAARDQVVEDVVASAPDEFDEARTACLAAALDRDLLLDVLARTLTAEALGDELQTRLDERLAACA